MMDTSIRVLLISGSTRQPAHTQANLEIVMTTLRKCNVNVSFWDLREQPLPLYNPQIHIKPLINSSAAVRCLTDLAEKADAFVWGTPVYHNSFSGVLKNALDNLNSQQFRHKPVALISNGGSSGGVQPCDQLRIVARALGAVVIPTQVVTSDADFTMTEGIYLLHNPSLQNRLVQMTEELIAYATLLLRLRKPSTAQHTPVLTS